MLQAKFFERVKIDRMIQKAKREVANKDSTKEQQDAAAAKLAQLEEDLQVHKLPLSLYWSSLPDAMSATGWCEQHIAAVRHSLARATLP